jgi:enoyl-CoA hydratase/carnithine racemase
VDYETVVYQKKEQIGGITLNRPEVNNAINVRLAEELIDICSEVSQDGDVRVVTITGTGEAFCVGADWSSSLPSETAPTKLLPVAEAVARLDCPVIAAINGDAMGQGLELALACDLRIAAETARLGLPQIVSGFIPWDGGTQRLPRLVGRAKAVEMILLGEPVSAREAYRIGLVNKVVTLEELSLVVANVAQRMASSAPLALKYAKEAIDKGLELTLEQGLHLEADFYSLLQTTQDRTEGVTAFRKKKQPKFKGK